jgi:hypothetical protein
MKYIAFWCGSMFPFGIYRQWNATLDPRNDLIGNRIFYSVTNGIVYISPFGIIKFADIFNRIDIKYNKKDSSLYPSCYIETNGFNYNLF